MSYCAECGKGTITAKELEEWKKSDAFIAWCRHSARGKKKLDPRKATGDWVKAFLSWEKEWSDMGCPG